ncbi:MAG TPA: twin-arginine translocase subunit TatC, partial [Burkholderiales bacterium]|nr:twin-arginine translocase subunit TatC [Burkholderiales bacterium]
MSEDTFISHLVELRDRLIRALLAVGAVTIVLTIWPGIGGVYDLLARPMTQALPEGTRMIATGVVSPVFVPLKVTILAALMLALPYVLYQIWAFVAPGLYAHEKRVALPLVISSTVLFFLGVAYCYFVVFRLIFHAIQSFAPEAITPAPDIEAYLS